MDNQVDHYKSIASDSFAEFKEKSSRFLAFAYFVQSEHDIKEKLEILKKEHFKATHHCFAYRLGLDNHNFRANDDGEPSGTAGKPILGQIDSFGLTNILIVVVRYYGGIKLGSSGLIAAYRAVAKEALEKSIIIEKTIESIFEVRFDYKYMNDVMKFIKSQDIRILESNFDSSQAYLKVSLRNGLKNIFLNQFEKWEDSKVEPF